MPLNKFFIKDRLLRGALAGIISGILLISLNLSSLYLFHFAKTIWTETMAQLIMGHGIDNIMDFIVAVGFQCIWNGFVGVLFVRFVIPKKEGNYLGRSIGLIFMVWFFLEAIGTMYHIKTLDLVQWQTVISNWVGIIVFGIILGWLTKKWDELEWK
jgi:hypothetical protein